jgi:DNA polymerase III subunit gamma/tau
MASQSLYRKWRSQTFDEMVGQEHIILTLRHALISNTLSHAYLFTGPRGTGKTSAARLLAKAVNCTNSTNGEPCNECSQCREITAGNSFNVIEIDAASNRGIDSIRELREKVMVPPSTGKYKIYILDEAHMLTTEAFNALLKTLEEPPSYAIFVMATTDVHKMLPTVLSRCQRFDFKRISTRQIVNHLLFVAQQETVEIERSAAELIARTAAGGMRDALSLLDQAIAYSGSAISLAQVQSMLGVADPRAISKLIAHIAGLDSPALLYLIHELSEAGADLRQINSQLIEYWRALMLAKAGADAATILDLTEDEIKEVQQLIPAFALEELTECARIFAQNELMQKNQGTPQLGLELAALECVELHRRIQSGGVARQSNPAPTPVQPSSHSVTSAPSARVPTSALQSAPPVSSRREELAPGPSRPVENRREELPVEHPQSIDSSPADEMMDELSVTPQTQIHLTLQQVTDGWKNVIKRTRQKNSAVGAYVDFCELVGVEVDNGFTLIILRAAQDRHLKFIRDGERPKAVEWALSTEFNVPCKLRVLAPDQAYAGSQSHNSLGVMEPKPSAYREPPRPAFETPGAKYAETPPQSRSKPEVPAPLPSPVQRTSAAPETSGVNKVPPLAILQEVRENKKVVLSQEELQKKATGDPVMQEFVKMFRAKIGDVEPK